MLRMFSFPKIRRSPTRAARDFNRFRPRLESLEGRAVPAAGLAIPPALGSGLVSAAPTVQQAASLLPITINSVDITGVANNALQLVANATTAGGRALHIPLTLTNVAPNATTPILNLHV